MQCEPRSLVRLSTFVQQHNQCAFQRSPHNLRYRIHPSPRLTNPLRYFKYNTDRLRSFLDRYGDNIGPAVHGSPNDCSCPAILGAYSNQCPKLPEMIPNNVPPVTGKELDYIAQVVNGGVVGEGGPFSKRCEHWLQEHLHGSQVFLTPSCTAALELAALSLDLDPGDEVIVPSYTYMSTANAFLLRGASLVYVDIDPGTMNIDPVKVREAITSKTRAIVPVHYAGVPCDMDAIFEAIGPRKDIYIVEDAAQGLFSVDKNGKALGTIGNLGCLSFGGTKNLTSGGAGGAIIVNDKKLIDRVETIREKGTNRPQFLKGEVDHYTWQRAGVSHVLSEMQAAYLWAQLECAEEIQSRRLRIWEIYRQALVPLDGERLELPPICLQGRHNAHIFFVKLQNKEEVVRFASAMKDKGISVSAHYSPLHRSVPGSCGRHVLHPQDYASTESERLIRLPLFYAMTETQAEYVIEQVKHYFA